MRLEFPRAPQPSDWMVRNQITDDDWTSWSWQTRKVLRTAAEFAEFFELAESERAGFAIGDSWTPIPAGSFQIRTTPYYASLASRTEPLDPIRRIFMPTANEHRPGVQQQLDPLAERINNPAPRLIHRYSDRVLFLVTDFCSVYCRYCTRKHFTGGEAAMASTAEYQAALSYLRSHTGIREVILSGGDPLTLSDSILEKILSDLRSIEHLEIIRIGSRMPVVNPFRMTHSLAGILKRAKPVYLMTHFNHPRELTQEAANGLELMVDHGIPVFNQMVLLNGVNNSAAVVQALSRRLIYLRVKPYYMFQCDPSIGTDHLRTSVEESLAIQRELWGHLSGLAMPTLSVDIPSGGGKATLVPEFEKVKERHATAGGSTVRRYKGWDGVVAEYVSPPLSQMIKPLDEGAWMTEWNELRSAKIFKNSDYAAREKVSDSDEPLESGVLPV